MFVDEAVPQITPVYCFSDFCGDPVGGLIYVSSIWTILIAGALIMPRWRDMLSVAAVACIATLGLEWMLYGSAAFPDMRVFASAFSGSYGFALFSALTLHGLKRGALWLVGYRAAPT
jgi:hypothetical protein